MTTQPSIRFSVIGLNHDHIYGQVNMLLRAGAELVAFFASEPELTPRFIDTYPQAKQAQSIAEILEDPTIQLIVSAAIPNERAALGIDAMQHGKDYLCDKPGFTALEQVAEVRKAQAETGRIYDVWYSEHVASRATVKAGELVSAGAIGRVVQTIGTGPHSLASNKRPDWFYQRQYYGGIINDIAAHQVEQFLYFTGSRGGEVASSHVANYHHPEYPQFEDFGEALLRGDGGTGYFRVDWFTPAGLGVWGDGRYTILGTDGYIELRKNVDIGGRTGGEHLFLVDQKQTLYIHCAEVELPYGRQLIHDILRHDEPELSQEHVFVASELALKAQFQSQQLGYLAQPSPNRP
jgi:predicted dehydrogenase